MLTDGVVLLTCEGESGRIAARYLTARFPSLAVIIEDPVPRALLLRRRIKRLGFVHVGGQLAFMMFQRMQQKTSQRRIAEIVRAAGLDARLPEGCELIRVPSVNSHECIGHLQRLRPQAILVIGTRIIAREVLRAVDAPFINYHAGITPKYRGVHGGYWAKAQGDGGNFGVTAHLVDEGIDTGDVLYQARLTPTRKDNYSTYPYLQLAAALPLLVRAAHDALGGTLRPEKIDLPSHLWSHPTLWSYIKTGLGRGIW
jgi:folate-dependent phosphoribosylglycinamide formyltransferase PurN